jgi:hypothetical protein
MATPNGMKTTTLNFHTFRSPIKSQDLRTIAVPKYSGSSPEIADVVSRLLGCLV